jgi:plasmid stabilization system protein ParE
VKWQVIIRPRAEADMLQAQQWYDSKRPGLGDEFLDVMRQTIRILEEDPERRPLYLFYRIGESRVVVFRIVHASRDHRRSL